MEDKYRNRAYGLMIILLCCSIFPALAQSNLKSMKKDFYKSKELYEKDLETFNLFKISRGEKITANTLGVLSLVSFAAGTYVVSQYESTGQSADLAIFVPIIGLYGVGLATGISGLTAHFSSVKSRDRAISLYQERYGIGLKIRENENSSIRINHNAHGIGLLYCF